MQLELLGSFKTGLSHSGETQNIFSALEKKGYHKEQLQTLAMKNALRFFAKVYGEIL